MIDGSPNTMNEEIKNKTHLKLNVHEPKVWFPDHGPRIMVFLFQVLLPIFVISVGALLCLFSLMVAFYEKDPSKLVAYFSGGQSFFDITRPEVAIGATVLSWFLWLSGLGVLLIAVLEVVLLSVGISGPLTYLHQMEKRRGYFFYVAGSTKPSPSQKIIRSLLSRGAFYILLVFAMGSLAAWPEDLSYIKTISIVLFWLSLLFMLIQIFMIEMHSKSRPLHDRLLGVWKLQSSSPDIDHSKIKLEEISYQSQYDPNILPDSHR